MGEKQRKKLPGRPFVKGDPRINRTKPGSGRPSLEYREALRELSPRALAVLERALRDKHASVRVAAARDILDRAHGKAVQPTEEKAPVRVIIADPRDLPVRDGRSVSEEPPGS